MCRGKVKNGQGLRNELPVERENVGLRNELESFWAWKCGAPERAWAVLSVKMRISGTPLTRGVAERFAFGLSRPWEAMNGLKLKKFLKMKVSGTAKFAKKCKMVMLRNGFFGNLWKWYAPERKFRAENWGSLLRHIPNMHTYGSTPPPPPHGGGLSHIQNGARPTSLRAKKRIFARMTAGVCSITAGSAAIFRDRPTFAGHRNLLLIQRFSNGEFWGRRACKQVTRISLEHRQTSDRYSGGSLKILDDLGL